MRFWAKREASELSLIELISCGASVIQETRLKPPFYSRREVCEFTGDQTRAFANRPVSHVLNIAQVVDNAGRKPGATQNSGFILDGEEEEP